MTKKSLVIILMFVVCIFLVMGCSDDSKDDGEDISAFCRSGCDRIYECKDSFEVALGGAAVFNGMFGDSSADCKKSCTEDNPNPSASCMACLDEASCDDFVTCVIEECFGQGDDPQQMCDDGCAKIYSCKDEIAATLPGGETEFYETFGDTEADCVSGCLGDNPDPSADCMACMNLGCIDFITCMGTYCFE